MKLILATRNRGKMSEFQALLASQQIEIAPMPEAIHVEEDGETYLENATKKAVACARSTGQMCLADDSGIEIDALSGAPGVQSARFLNGAPDEEKCARILEMIQDSARRGARFVIVLALADPYRVHFTAQAEVAGEISTKSRGTCGFGYDPIFIPAGRTRTMAELAASEKNTLSHRARSVRALERFLKYRDSISGGLDTRR